MRILPPLPNFPTGLILWTYCLPCSRVFLLSSLQNNCFTCYLHICMCNGFSETISLTKGHKSFFLEFWELYMQVLSWLLNQLGVGIAELHVWLWQNCDACSFLVFYLSVCERETDQPIEFWFTYLLSVVFFLSCHLNCIAEHLLWTSPTTANLYPPPTRLVLFEASLPPICPFLLFQKVHAFVISF